MTEKRKTLTVKTAAQKVADKVVDAVKEIGDQPMQEQALMQGNVPQEPKPEPKAEPESPAAVERRKAKDAGIDLINKDGVNVESKDGKIFVTYPNRKDIDYTMTKSTGLPFEKVGYADAQESDKLYPRERLQVRTVAFKAEDLNPESMPKIAAAIDKARAINAEYRAEKDAAMDYFKEIAADKEIRVFGKPFITTEHQDGTKETKPSYFNADVVKVGKHLIAGVEGSTDKAVYVRLVETNTLPFVAQEYSDKQAAARKHLGIRDENLVKATVNGKEQEIIKDAKRHIAYNSDWEISKVAPYEPKQEQTKPKTKRVANTMAQ